MENEHIKPKASAKDVIIHLGAIVALYTSVIALLNVLFTVINAAWPQVDTYSYGVGSSAISFPVATLIIFFPIFLVLSWLIGKTYAAEPEKKQLGVRKWLAYITLFFAGLATAIDLVYVLFQFLNGNELTLAFLLKALAVLLVTLMVFWYYLADIREKISVSLRKAWLWISIALVLGSIIWGFVVLGSPYAQRSLRYDEQKLSDLQMISNQVVSFYETAGYIPRTLSEMASSTTYFTAPLDPQTHMPYEYTIIGQSAKAYELCATFNASSTANGLLGESYPVQPVSGWSHPAGHYCFDLAIPLSLYRPVPTVK